MDERISPARPDTTPASADRCLRAEVERSRRENRQMQQALASHAMVDQAIGVLTVMGQISPEDGFTVLREVSQRTNIKLSAVAEHILKRARGAALPEADPRGTGCGPGPLRRRPARHMTTQAAWIYRSGRRPGVPGRSSRAMRTLMRLPTDSRCARKP